MLSRKKFIGAASASVAAASVVEWIRPAAAAMPRAKLSDIDHFIILMQENRSFDHYFGTLSGVRGFDDSTAVLLKNGHPAFYQPDPGNPSGFALPFHLDTTKTNAQRVVSLSHAWSAQHSAWNCGLNDNWLPAHREADGANGPLTMGYYTRADLPFYYALADAFTICDGYHCSVMGPTWPNRLFLMSGTNDPTGKMGGPLTKNTVHRFMWETYPERLERAGISWRIYHADDDLGSLEICGQLFARYMDAPTTSPLYENAIKKRSVDVLLNDLRTGNLPQVTWIAPPVDVCEHPSGLPIAGENFVRRVLQALWENPKLWKKTAFILSYDENDGFFDHVVPPTPEVGTPDEYVDGVPAGLGFRVPCMVFPRSLVGVTLVAKHSITHRPCGYSNGVSASKRRISVRGAVRRAEISRRRSGLATFRDSTFLGFRTPNWSLSKLPWRYRRCQIPSYPRSR